MDGHGHEKMIALFVAMVVVALTVSPGPMNAVAGVVVYRRICEE